MFLRSTDDGLTWQATDTTTHFHVDAMFAGQSSLVYVFGRCHGGNDTVKVVVSTDYGATWGSMRTAADFSPMNGHRALYAVDGGGRLHVSFDDEDGEYYTRSTDGGETWSQPWKFATYANLTWIGATGDAVYMSYLLNSVWRKRVSTDGGATWQGESVWPSGVGPDASPVALTDAGRVHLLQSSSYGYSRWIEYRQSKDFAETWPDSVRLSDSSTVYRFPSAITLAGNDVHVLWIDSSCGNLEVFYRKGAGLAGCFNAANATVRRRPDISLLVRTNPSIPPILLEASFKGQIAAVLSIYGALGGLVRRVGIVRAEDPHSTVLAWDGRDDYGRSVPAGTYLVRLEAGAQSAAIQCIVVR